MCRWIFKQNQVDNESVSWFVSNGYVARMTQTIIRSTNPESYRDRHCCCTDTSPFVKWRIKAKSLRFSSHSWSSTATACSDRWVSNRGFLASNSNTSRCVAKTSPGFCIKGMRIKSNKNRFVLNRNSAGVPKRTVMVH